MAKLTTKLKKTATKKLFTVPILNLKVPLWGAALVVGALYQQRMMPSVLTPAPIRAEVTDAPVMPSVKYGYDAYPPLRNEPYYNTTHMFGPADGDPVFYGVPGWH